MQMSLGATIETEGHWDPESHFSAHVPWTKLNQAHGYPFFPPASLSSTAPFVWYTKSFIKIICGSTFIIFFFADLLVSSDCSLCTWFPGDISCCLCRPEHTATHRVFQWGFHKMVECLLFAVSRMFYQLHTLHPLGLLSLSAGTFIFS